MGKVECPVCPYIVPLYVSIPMNNTQISLVMAWLQSIEAFPDEIRAVMHRCASNSNALQHFLMRAMDVEKLKNLSDECKQARLQIFYENNFTKGGANA